MTEDLYAFEKPTADRLKAMADERGASPIPGRFNGGRVPPPLMRQGTTYLLQPKSDIGPLTISGSGVVAAFQECYILLLDADGKVVYSRTPAGDQVTVVAYNVTKRTIKGGVGDVETGAAVSIVIASMNPWGQLLIDKYANLTECASFDDMDFADWPGYTDGVYQVPARNEDGCMEWNTPDPCNDGSSSSGSGSSGSGSGSGSGSSSSGPVGDCVYCPDQDETAISMVISGPENWLDGDGHTYGFNTSTLTLPNTGGCQWALEFDMLPSGDPGTQRWEVTKINSTTFNLVVSDVSAGGYVVVYSGSWTADSCCPSGATLSRTGGSTFAPESQTLSSSGGPC